MKFEDLYNMVGSKTKVIVRNGDFAEPTGELSRVSSRWGVTGMTTQLCAGLNLSLGPYTHQNYRVYAGEQEFRQQAYPWGVIPFDQVEILLS